MTSEDMLREMLQRASAEIARLREENTMLRAELEAGDIESLAAELCDMLDDAGIGPDRVGVMSLEAH